VEGSGAFRNGLHLLAGLLAHAAQEDGLVDPKKHAVPAGRNGDARQSMPRSTRNSRTKRARQISASNGSKRNEEALLD